jgi:hypothetical protein
MDAIPLAKAVGERVNAIRSRSGTTLERIAAEARELGLKWAKSSVAAIEKGQHALGLGELLLLPTILQRAGARVFEYTAVPEGDGWTVSERRPVTVADLLPYDDRPILLAGTVHMPARALCDLLGSMCVYPLDHPVSAPAWKAVKVALGEETAEEARRLPQGWRLKMIDAIARHQGGAGRPDNDEAFWLGIQRNAADDATRKAAVVLGVPPIAVALAARACWNGVRGLTDQRERRLAALLPPEQRHDPAKKRTLQALRAHITRELLDELRPLLADITKKKRRTR